MIISLYAGGMTIRDIQHHLVSTIGTELSHETIANITDAVLEAVMEWQNRPLEEFYPVIYLDAIRVKVRDNGHVRSKAAHIAVGVDMDGIKHVLGIWVQYTEGASFWAWIAPGIIEAGRLEEGDSLMPVKCSDELKARAVDLVLHAQADKDSAHGAITRVANELGLSKETLRVWVRKHKSSGQDTPGESVGLEVENRRLRAELAEARRANEILRKASAFFAAELDRPSK